VYRTRRRFVEGNLGGGLSEEPRTGAARKLSRKEEALLVATACSKAPAGCAMDAEVTGGTDGGVDRAYDAVARDDPPQAARKRIEALAAQDVVYCESGW
jgi:anaerobic selenocysteine-containing dehydrogenase